MAVTFLFLKIIEKFKLLVKGIDQGKKKYFCHFRVSQIFFFQKFKIKVKIAKITQRGTYGGVHFFWPKMFPDQFTMKSKNKKKHVFSFLGFFCNLVHPIFQNFMKNQVLWRKKHFRGVVDKQKIDYHVIMYLFQKNSFSPTPIFRISRNLENLKNH